MRVVGAFAMVDHSGDKVGAGETDWKLLVVPTNARGDGTALSKEVRRYKQLSDVPTEQIKLLHENYFLSIG